MNSIAIYIRTRLEIITDNLGYQLEQWLSWLYLVSMTVKHSLLFLLTF